ncbi:MAG: phytanoyl-CoA dioxygenase family protein [Sphingomonadales bacterium]
MKHDLPKMPPLDEANALLDDPRALMSKMDRDGYLFFRDVLDMDAVTTLKRRYMDVLVDMGVVDAGSEDPIWNGKELTDFPVKIEPLHNQKVWEEFTSHPGIEAFFTRMLGAAPFWLPIVEYRITPPEETLPDDTYWGRHQDGFYNGDLACYTCWVPLMEIGHSAGGLAMAPGLHRQGYLNDLNDPPQYMIPGDAIPDTAWRRSHYHAGDLVVFNHMIPHAGMSNLSDRFRMSMDVRVMPVTADLPVWGTVLSFDSDAIRVLNHDGRTVTLAVTEDTYCRWTSGRRMPVEELIALIPTGDSVLAFVDGDRATMLRPPR